MKNSDLGEGEVVVMIGEIVKSHGLTPSELSQLTGLSRPSCYKLIEGDIKRIELNTLAKLCHVLHVPIQHLLFYQPVGELSAPGQIG